MVRIIVEGMDRDNTGLNFYIAEMDIPLETGSIKFWGGTLTYRGRMKNGKFEEAPHGGCLEVTVSKALIFESTQTVVIEDGRVFHCDSNNKERLEVTLKDIFAKAGSFDSAYRQIEENPGKFMRY